MRDGSCHCATPRPSSPRRTIGVVGSGRAWGPLALPRLRSAFVPSEAKPSRGTPRHLSPCLYYVANSGGGSSVATL